MIGGFVTTVLWVVFFKAGFYDLYEMLPGFAAGLGITILVSPVAQPPPGARQEMNEVREKVGPVFRRRRSGPGPLNPQDRAECSIDGRSS